MAPIRGIVAQISILAWRGSFYSTLEFMTISLSVEDPCTCVAELQNSVHFWAFIESLKDERNPKNKISRQQNCFIKSCRHLEGVAFLTLFKSPLWGWGQGSLSVWTPSMNLICAHGWEPPPGVCWGGWKGNLKLLDIQSNQVHLPGAQIFLGGLRNSKHDFVLKEISINYETNGKLADKTEVSNQHQHNSPYWPGLGLFPKTALSLAPMEEFGNRAAIHSIQNK